jgi:hypothetical protein
MGIRIIRYTEKRILTTWVRKWFCAAAVYGAKPNLIKITIQQRLGINLDYIMSAVAIIASVEEAYQPILGKPEEYFLIK